MNITYIVQRTIPDHLTGSETYIYELANNLHDSFIPTIVATRRVKNDFLTRIKYGSRIITFKEFPVGYLTAPIRSAIKVLNDQKLLNLFAQPLNGFFHSSSWGYFSLGIKEFLETNDFEVIHSAALPTATAWLSWRITKKRNIPLVLTPFFHYSLPDFNVPWIKKVLEDSSAIIAVTEIEKRKMVEFGIDESKIHLIPLGIDHKIYKEKETNTFRQRYGFDEDLFLVFIPRKGREKGTFDTLKAIVNLIASFKKIGVILSGETPKYTEATLNEYKRIISNKGIKIVDLGFVAFDELIEAYQSCDVVVEPSKVESFGIVYLEAWACGKPVIAANFGAVPDIVHNNENGLLVEYGNWKEIENALRCLIYDNKLRKSLGENGINDVKVKYSRDNMISKTEYLYNSINQ